jgi:hypothetical protein
MTWFYSGLALTWGGEGRAGPRTGSDDGLGLDVATMGAIQRAESPTDDRSAFRMLRFTRLYVRMPQNLGVGSRSTSKSRGKAPYSGNSTLGGMPIAQNAPTSPETPENAGKGHPKVLGAPWCAFTLVRPQEEYPNRLDSP